MELIARTTTFRSNADVEADLFDGSGETTVAPLDSELYAQVKLQYNGRDTFIINTFIINLYNKFNITYKLIK